MPSALAPVATSSTALATHAGAARLGKIAAVGVGAAGTGIALSLALPPADLGALAWIALLPAVVAARGLNMRSAFALGWVAGLLGNALTFRWLLEVPAIGALQFLVLDGYVSLYLAAWCALLVPLRASRVPLALSAAAAWVMLDLVRAHAGFLALPWGTLAHTQHQNLALLQLAAISGEAGIAFVVVAVNVALAQALVSRRPTRGLAVTAALVAAVHGAGAVALWRGDAVGGASMMVAAVQPALPTDWRRSAESRHEAWQRLQTLTLDAGNAGAQLIVWPETSVADPQHDRLLAARLSVLASRIRVPLVVGASETEKFEARSEEGTLELRQRDAYNSAFFVTADHVAAEPYRKRRLVPFAEYQPLAGVLPWPRWLVPGQAVGQAGRDDARWSLPDGTRIGVSICWESAFAALARESVGNGAQLLLQLTNDAWFGASAAAAQHNLASVLRAVENRVPVVIASNAGPSQVIDAYGRVVARATSMFTAQTVVATLRPGIGATPYSRFGEVLAAGCTALLALMLVARSLKQPHGRRSR